MQKAYVTLEVITQEGESFVHILSKQAKDASPPAVGVQVINDLDKSMKADAGSHGRERALMAALLKDGFAPAFGYEAGFCYGIEFDYQLRDGSPLIAFAKIEGGDDEDVAEFQVGDSKTSAAIFAVWTQRQHDAAVKLLRKPNKATLKKEAKAAMEEAAALVKQIKAKPKDVQAVMDAAAPIFTGKRQNKPKAITA